MKRKLFRRRCLALAMVAAALALVAGLPTGALAAGDESTGSSTTGESLAAPATSSPAVTAPASSGWTSQGAGTGTSSETSAPLRRGSSVGSDGVPSQSTAPSESAGEGPSYTTASSGYTEPESSTPSTVAEPASAPRAGSGGGSVGPPPPTTGKAVRVAVGAAAPVTLPESPPRRVNLALPVTAAASPDSGDRGGSGSYVLPVLVVLVLGLILGFACVRLGRRRRQRQLEVLWRQQDAEWEAALRRVKLEPVLGASKEDQDSAPQAARHGSAAWSPAA
jgi:hypothetical protein